MCRMCYTCHYSDLLVDLLVVNCKRFTLWLKKFRSPAIFSNQQILVNINNFGSKNLQSIWGPAVTECVCVLVLIMFSYGVYF